MKYLLLFTPLILLLSCQKKQEKDRPALAEQVTIYRDTWGVPHVVGETDAAAVFGLLYAQCEDNFTAVEYNLVKAMGRLAEWDGDERSLIRDLQIRLYMDIDEAKTLYKKAPEWMQHLCEAAAEGVNWYLRSHPEVQPKILTSFEPWMWLFHFEGSITKNIDNDIQGPQRTDIGSYYFPDQSSRDASVWLDEGESNSFAVGNNLSVTGNPLLYINPHTYLHYRTEAHIISKEGLNAYGAITWGQFFIYQGFNENNGWAHTTSYADNIDQFILETNSLDPAESFIFNKDTLTFTKKQISLAFKADQEMKNTTVEILRTSLGPVTHQTEHGSPVVTKIHWRPLKSLEQSFKLMKTGNLKEFKEVLQIRADATNNTMYAGKDGNIAYFHGNFMPKRPENRDYSNPYPVSDSTDVWQGLHEWDDMITLEDPENGWIINCNSTPFMSAGKDSPKQEDYPPYMATDPENFRVRLADSLFSQVRSLDIDGLIDLAYYNRFPAHMKVKKSLVNAFKESGTNFPELNEPMRLIKEWDGQADETSVAYNLVTLYLFDGLLQRIIPINGPGEIISYVNYLSDSLPAQKQLLLFKNTLDSLTSEWGRWEVPYGDLVRYQRLEDPLSQHFSDENSSLPMARGSAIWGDLSSFEAYSSDKNKSWYGVAGNSFVAAVEFGENIRAKALMAGGQSAHSHSPYFDDQAKMYTEGEFREVLFYMEDILNNLESQYKPGEELPRQNHSKE
ncbi:acylase [Robertkochia marina]|uniref:Acylase n=1 Tax=Robertkochia marina TaxID=1227945 RepID=A0A4V3UYD4_9FLAO|nr:penicillin acylase family protein [Robertkochia marina]THD69268.1 acylase [Robertkochia marina]TRZ47473.1 acylase [Robertkochia marina]